MSAPKLTGEPTQLVPCHVCGAEPLPLLEFSVWGGWSYSAGVELFPSILDAARVYLERMDEGYVDGVRFPLWGEMADDDYAIADESFGYSVAELRQLVRDAERSTKGKR